MKLLLAHIKFNLVRLLRTPTYWVPTVLFPMMLYSFFGASLAPAGTPSQLSVASFCVYAVLGVAFYQFGANAAQDREHPFDGWLRTLPSSTAPSLLSQLIAAIFFALIAVALVLAASLFFARTRVPLDSVWGLLAACLAISIPAGLMGMALGLFSSARGAAALANLIFLPLAFLGGLWLPPSQLPAAVAGISIWTPTRQMGELAWSAISGQPLETRTTLLLGAYTLGFALLVWVLARRDTRKRFG